MTSVDITLTQTSNDFKCDSFEIPFIGLMKNNSQSIIAIKELLMGTDSNIWLKEANEIVLQKLMSWKDN